MKHAKTFDCIAMKDQIQKDLLAMRKGMDDNDIQQQIREELASSDSLVAKYWRKMKQDALKSSIGGSTKI